MKTIFDKATRNQLAQRILMLQEGHTALWGKMTAAQMMKHCAQWDEMAQGKTQYRQSLLGKLFGKMALKDMMKDEPMKSNLPTVPAFKISGAASFDNEKERWLQLLSQYEQCNSNGFIHPFFGKLTKEQAGMMAYKHADHHLRQFGV